MNRKPIIMPVMAAVLAAQLLASCVLEKNDIYEEIPRGTSLSRDMLSRADQIVVNDKDVLILINTSDTWEYYDPHVVFFDSTLTCRAACYFPASVIDSISKSKKIYGLVHEERDKRKSSFRNDLYDGYTFQWADPNVSTGARRSDKIIQGFQVASDYKIILHTLQSSDRYENENKTLDLTKFTKPDTLVFPLSSMFINPKKRKLNVSIKGEYNLWITEGMVFRDSTLQNDFYDKLFERISKR